jgi:hypothetical protein
MRIPQLFSYILGVCLLTFAALTPESQAAEAESNMAQKIVALRSEIDSMTSGLQTQREEHRAQVTSFSTRRADLDIAIERDQSLLQQIEQKIAEARTSNSSLKDNSEKMMPDFLKLTEHLKDYIATSIPYSRKDRLESVDMLVNQVRGGELNVFTAMGRLWALIEDEFRVVNEINISEQMIAIEGKEYLSSVIKIGSALLFYRSNDGRFGYASRKDTGDWEFIALEGKENKRMITNLFDSLKMQVRVGLFELPMVLSQPSVAPKLGG